MAAIVIAIAIGCDDDDETDDKTFTQLLPFEILIYLSVHRKEKPTRLRQSELCDAVIFIG